MSGRVDPSAREAVEAALDDLDDLDDAQELEEVEEALAAPGMPEEVRERLRALRAHLRTPLRERRAMRELGDLGDDPAPADPGVHATGPRAGRPRGLAALIPTAAAQTYPVDAEPVAEPRVVVRRSGGVEPDREVVTGPWDGHDRRRGVRVDGRHRLEADWLVSSQTRVLHHAPLSVAECEVLAADEGVERDDDPEPFVLSCGRTAWALARPNRIERAAQPRCDGCCEVLGYPPGHGSPAADDDCTPRLLERLGKLL